MNCLIIDADQSSSKPLEKVIKKSPNLKLVANCTSVIEAADVFLKSRIDLIFIEGQVQCGESTEFLEYVSQKKPQVIAFSSVTEVGKVRFDFKITDFILKPVSNTQLNRIVNKIISDQNHPPDPGSSESFIYIRANRTFLKIATKDISFVQALSDYVRIHTTDKVHTTYSTMKQMVEKLPEKDFIRVHRSYIVRINSITQFQDGFITVDKRLVPIGKLYKDQLMKRLNMFG